MSEKRTLEADRKLINVLFSIEPLDFCRRDDGTLVIIHPDGKKTIHTPEEIDRLSAASLARRSAGSERASREASGDARLSAGSGRSTGGPTAVKKPAAAASLTPDAPAPPAVDNSASKRASREASGDARLGAVSNRGTVGQKLGAVKKVSK